MLKTLRIEHLALIDQAEFDFEKGLICFTGETGAGKSVFLSALRLLAGQRCERLSLRPGTDFGKIEGLFQFKGSILDTINTLCEANDIAPCEEGELILRRTFGARTKISINGSLASLNVLKQLGALWLEFHTPNEPQRLFSPETQLELLDKFVHIEAERTHYAQSYQSYITLYHRLKTLQAQIELNPEVLAFSKDQLRIMEQIELDPQAIEQLEQDFKRISQKEEGMRILKEIEVLLDGEPGVNFNLDRLQNSLNTLVQCMPHLAPLLEQYQQIRLELQDIESTCAQEQDAFNLDPEQCEKIQQNMHTWLDLQRRYGPTLEQVLAAKQDLIAQIDMAEHGEAQLQQVALDCERAETICRKEGKLLHQLRLQCLSDLDLKVEHCLMQLGFKHPKFMVDLERTQNLTPQGCSAVCFKFASDQALSCMPLQNVASSGELSRLLLALKNVLQDTQNTPVLVFDEIDANVGGEMGKKVGELLKNLGQNAQVFCVTHLPQVAGQAHTHYCVTKESLDIPTIQFTKLNTQQERLQELARMLGDAQSQSALQHAETLLKTLAVRDKLI